MSVCLLADLEPKQSSESFTSISVLDCSRFPFGVLEVGEWPGYYAVYCRMYQVQPYKGQQQCKLCSIALSAKRENLKL